MSVAFETIFLIKNQKVEEIHKKLYNELQKSELMTDSTQPPHNPTKSLLIKNAIGHHLFHVFIDNRTFNSELVQVIRFWADTWRLRERQETFEQYIVVAKKIYEAVNLAQGYSGTDEKLSANPTKDHNLIGLLTFFGPDLVKQIGRKKLLSAPAFKVEELNNGGIFIRASKKYDWNNVEKIAQHLGEPYKAK